MIYTPVPRSYFTVKDRSCFETLLSVKKGLVCGYRCSLATGSLVGDGSSFVGLPRRVHGLSLYNRITYIQGILCI